MKKIYSRIKTTVIIFLVLSLLLISFPGTAFADPVFSDTYGHLVEWWNFRNSLTNNAVTDRPTPTTDLEAWEKWSVKYGSGYTSAPTPPLIIDGKLYVGVNKTILEVDKETGDVLRSSEEMPGNIGYAMQSPVYADGKIFIAITNGRICAVNLDDLSIAWTTDNTTITRGQTVSPISYVKIDGTGYVYTGTWTKSGGSLFCATTGDDNVILKADDNGQETKIKKLVWVFNPSDEDKENLEANNSVAYGYYWTGAYVTERYLAIGSDNGSTLGDDVNDTAFYTLNPRTGKIIDAVYGIKGQVRSTVVYEGGNLYFTTKGAKIYKIPVDEAGKLGEPSFVDMSHFGALMATATPVVYGGKIYLGVQGKGGQFSADGGHGFLVLRDDEVLSDSSFLYNLRVPGYPQAGALLSNYHEEEDFNADGIADGRVYLFFTYNAMPGGIFYTYDTPDQTEPTLLSAEEAKIFVPGKDKQQYCISSIVVDEEGNLYYKNDSGYLFAVESNPAALAGMHLFDESGNEVLMDQTFMAKMADYTLTVPSASKKLRIVLDLFDGVTAKVGGQVYKAGGVTVPLEEDITELQIVTEKNGKQRTYCLTVSKASANADLAALGSAKGNTPPSERNQNTRAVTPELDKTVEEYTFDWITTGTGDAYDPAGTNLMNIFVKPENSNASVAVWPGENTLLTNANSDGSVKAYASSGGYTWRFPVYSADISRDSTATIIVTAEDGETRREYHILFSRRVYVTSLELDRTELVLCPSDISHLTASVLPENATDPSVTWISSDDSVVMAAEDGTVTAVAPGQATVTAAAEDGTVTAECQVSVLEEETLNLSGVTVQMDRSSLLMNGSEPAVFRQLQVHAGNAKAFDYIKSADKRAKVTALDVLIELHKKMFGASFADMPDDYLTINEEGCVTKAFGQETEGMLVSVNDQILYEEEQPCVLRDILPKANDRLRFITQYEGRIPCYLVFDREDYHVHAGEDLKLTVAQMPFSGLSEDSETSIREPAAGAVVSLSGPADLSAAVKTADEEGTVIFTAEELSQLPADTGFLTVCSYEAAETERGGYSVPYADLYITPHELEFKEPSEPTCDNNGYAGCYICKICHKQYADAEAKEEIMDPASLVLPAGHLWDEGVMQTEENCDGAAVTVFTCRRDASHVRKIAEGKEGHIWAEEYETDEMASCERSGSESLHCLRCGAIDPESVRHTEPLGHRLEKLAAVPSDCTEAGIKDCYYCNVCGRYFLDEEAKEEISEEDVVEAPLGHQWVFAGFRWNGSAEKGDLTAEAVYTCERDETHVCTIAVLPETERSEPGCEKEGCILCRVSVSEQDSPDRQQHSEEQKTFLSPLGHDWGQGVVTLQPTKNRVGIRTYTCKRNHEHKKTESIPYVAVTGLKLNVTETELAIRDSLQLTPLITPSDATDARLKWKSSNPAVAVVDENGKITAKAYGKATVTASAPDGKTAVCKVQTRFRDVMKGQVADSIFRYIYWGADKGIIGGYGTGFFGRKDGCTRAQFATMIWKMAGAPRARKAASAYFSDVKKSAAISWAYEKGVIGGYKDGTFRPSGALTRSNFVMMLWKQAGKPSPRKGVKAKTFSDVPKSKGAYKAVQWASSYGIINGYGNGKFGLRDNCTRQQIVTMLYKYTKNYNR